MATFEIVEGRPGQGKSLYTAKKAKELVQRNKKYFKKTGKVRKIYSNVKFSQDFENSSMVNLNDYCDSCDNQDYFIRKNSSGICCDDRSEREPELVPLIHYWDKVNQITEMRDADLLWDEIATELDSRNFANLSEELKIFLSQYRKRGVDIYANTQDYSMVDMRARLMVTSIKSLKKLIGSRDPTPTKPEIKRIWGIVLIREVEEILADDAHKKKYSMIPGMFFIEKDDVDIYDTTQGIPRSPRLPRQRHYREVHYVGGEKDGTVEYEYTR